MSRLADRIFTGSVVPPSWLQVGDWQSARRAWNKGLRETLQHATIVAIDNVTELYYAGSDQEHWDIATDFPCLSPPFPLAFIETTRPSRIRSAVHGEHSAEHLPRSWGVLFEAADHEGFRHFLANVRDRDDVPAIFWHLIEGLERPAQAGILSRSLALEEARRILEAHPEVRWGLWLRLFVEKEKGEIIAPVCEWMIATDAQGRVVGSPYAGSAVLPEGPQPPQGVVDGFSTLAHPALLAMSLMHCRNVQIRTESPPPKLSKAHQRKTGRPLVKFWTLDIHPMREVLRTEGRSEAEGLRKALHICRGHFKDYRERGLFGKHKGLYWWDMHVRGSADQGAVVKDYAVHAPEGEPPE